MLRVKEMTLSKEQEDFVLDCISKCNDMSLVLHTEIVEKIYDNSVLLFKEYKLYIKDFDSKFNIHYIRFNEDTNELEFKHLKNSKNVIFTLPVKDKFYNLEFDTIEKQYIISSCDKKVNLQAEYPIINTEIKEFEDSFKGCIYIKISPLEFNKQKLIYEYTDKDYDAVLFDIHKQRKYIESNIKKFSQLYLLSTNNLIIFKDKSDNLAVGKCKKTDDIVLTLDYVYGDPLSFKSFIYYKDIIDDFFVVLRNGLQLVKIYNDDIILLSNTYTINKQECEDDLNENKEYILNWENIKNEIIDLYDAIYLTNDEHSDEEIEEYKSKLIYFDGYINTINQLLIFEEDTSGFLIIDPEDNIRSIKDIPKYFDILDRIRYAIYKED